MIGLIRKDFYLNRKMLFGFLAMCLFYAVIMIVASFFMRTTMSKDDPSFMANVALLSMTNALLFFMCSLSVQSMMMQTDLGKKTRYYFSASPVGIKGFIASKYYECFLIAFFTFLYCEIYDLVLSAIYGTLLNNSLIHLALLIMSVAVQSLAIPFLIGFGKHGTHIKTVFLLLLFGCAIVYGLFGDISAIMEKGGINNLLHSMMSHADNDSIMAILLGVAYPALVCILLLPHIFILLVYASYRISCALFRKGAMTYDD